MSDRITLPLYQTGWSSEAPLADRGTGHLLSCKNYVIKQNLLESRKSHFKILEFEHSIETIIPLQEYNMLILCGNNTLYVYEIVNNLYVERTRKTGLSGNHWRWAYMNHQIIMVNGLDAAQQIFVTDFGKVTQEVTIQDWAVTGVSSKIFDWVSVLNAQVTCGYGNDLVAWYLPVGYLQGELKQFDIGASAGTPKKGGSIIGGFNISRDGGMSLNAYIGFMTDQGEAIVYSGNDLDDADNVQFNGVYQTGIPLGKTPFINWSGDLIIMTNKGFVSAHSIFANGENQSAQFLFSQRINTWLLEQTSKFGRVPGFMGLVVPSEDFVLFNIPQDNGTFVQACMNITSGKWSLFTEINAHTMCVMGSRLLFGMKDGVYEYGAPIEDDKFIPLEIWTSYNNCGTDLLKRINMLQLRHSSTSKINISYSVYKDFEYQPYYNWIDLSETIDSIGDTGFYWSNGEDEKEGTAYWGEEYWAGGLGDYLNSLDTYSAPGMGHNFGIRMTANVKNMKHQVVDLMLLFNASKTAI